MFAGKLLLLALVATAIFCSDTTSTCKLVPDFGGVGNATVASLPKNSKYCRNLNSTCCNATDFEQMRNVWEGKVNNVSLRGERTKEMKEMIGLVGFLEKAHTDLLWFSQEIKKAKINADPACGTPAYIHRKMEDLELIKTAVVTFKQTGKQCWEYTKNLMNGLMCAACDHQAQDFIDYKKKELTISGRECRTFLDSCGEHLRAIAAVYFYYNTYHRLTYCDTLGRFSVQKVPDFSNFPKNIRKAIEGCLNSKNQDDCITVCQSQIGFTTMANFEYHNKARLLTEQTDILNFMVKMNKTRNSKAQSKRLLQTELVAKNVSETLARINNYTIRVARTGLRLSKYTVDDVDGYKDISAVEVFSAKIVTAAVAWLLFATVF
jgi:hypothetical protein